MVLKRFLLLMIFLSTFGLDRISKIYLDSIQQMGTFGPFYIETHTNSGFILQTLSQISSLTRIVFVSSLYGFLLFAFILLLDILPETVKMLRVGLTLFFAAITGNAFDRAFLGGVIDFINFSTLSRNYYFNLADVFMWVGTGMILYSLFAKESILWHPDSQRKKYLINSTYQIKLALKTAFVSFCTTLILVLFSYTYIMNVHGEKSGAFLFSSCLLGVVFSIITFFTAVVFSHRSAGPLYAFEKYVNALMSNSDEAKISETDFKLRHGDEHKNLIELAEKLKERFQRR